MGLPPPTPMWDDVTVCIPRIPERSGKMFHRALASVSNQTLLPRVVLSKVDEDGRGAAATKNFLLRATNTEFVAFLDDDDELLPRHLEALLEGQQESGADVVYAWPDGKRGLDPAPHKFGRPFDWGMLLPYNVLPSTSLFRTETFRRAGGFQYPGNLVVDGRVPYALMEGAWRFDDWGAYLALWHAKASFHHVAERTWIYHHHPGQTAGIAAPRDVP